MKNKYSSVAADAFLYYCSFIPYLIIKFLETTMFPLPSLLQSGAKYLLLIALFSVLFKKKVTLRYLFVSVILLIISVIVWKQTSYTLPLEASILMIGGYGLSERAVFRIYFKITTFLLLMTFIASQIGMVENLQYFRSSGQIRNSFGIIYPTDFASHVFYLCLVGNYLYFEKYPKLLSFISILSSLFIYYYSDARLDALSIILIVILFNFVKFINKGFFLKLFSFFVILSYPIMAYMSVFLSKNYNSGIELYNIINRMISGRLYLGQKALDLYGLHFWGNHIVFFGNGGTTQKVLDYNFVDSSYLKLFLTLGIVFMLFLLAIFVCKTIFIVNIGDYYLLVVFLIIAINSLIAHHLLELTYNVFFISLLNWELMKEKNRGDI